MDQSHLWAVILAGGEGSRLLPLTRRITGDERPKQFCPVLGPETLLCQTRRRAARIVPKRQIMVVLTAAHETYYRDEVRDLGPSSLLVQPCNRGTAPAILWALTRLVKLDPHGLTAFLPSDHYIADEIAFGRCLDSAFRQVGRNPETVILVGVPPDTPETDYGWIEPGDPLPEATAPSFWVKCFWEKPSRTLAASLMRGGCLWNTFIMVARVDAFLGLFERAAPEQFRSLSPMMFSSAEADAESWRRFYSGVDISNFSQAVLAGRSDGLAVMRGDALGWTDLGNPDRVLTLARRMGVRSEWSIERLPGHRLATTTPAA